MAKTYIAVKFRTKGEVVLPCGMNNIVAMGKYASVTNFIKYRLSDSRSLRVAAVRGWSEIVIFDDTDKVVSRIDLTKLVDFSVDIVGRREAGYDFRYTLETQTRDGSWSVVLRTHCLDEATRNRQFRSKEYGETVRIIDESA